jgi:hypothetical protein
MEVAIGIIVAVLVIGAAVAVGMSMRRERPSGSVLAVERGDDQRASTSPNAAAPDGEERSI